MKKTINLNTLQISGVSMHDYPDFCGSYVDSGQYVDGTSISDRDLDDLNNNYPEIAQERAYESLLD